MLTTHLLSIILDPDSLWYTSDQLQDHLYHGLNTLSKSHKTLGRFLSIPVSILDVAIDTLKHPLVSIARIALAAIILIRAAFDTNRSLKDSLRLIEDALGSAVHTPVALALAPVKIIFQLFVIIIDPKKVNSISSLRTFKEELTWSRQGFAEKPFQS